jgi:hypothetical protein
LPRPARAISKGLKESRTTFAFALAITVSALPKEATVFTSIPFATAVKHTAERISVLFSETLFKQIGVILTPPFVRHGNGGKVKDKRALV